VATKADIEIAVKGIQKLKEAKKEINKLNRAINDSNKDIVKEAKKKKVVDKANKTNVGAASQVRSINTLNKQLSTATRNFNRVALGTKDAAKAALQLKQAQDALNVAYAQQNDLLGKNVQAQGAFSRISDRQSRNAEGQRTRMNNPLVRGISKIPGLNPTKGFDTESALISGAFPLLFGQGPIGALAGGLGGGIGGMFGGMGGFAGGIAATAIVQQIQGLLDGVSKLGQAMSPLVKNTQAVTTALGLQGSIQEAQINRIEQTQGKTAAFNASMKLMGNRIDQEGIDKIKNFGETTRLLGQQFAVALLKLQAFAAGIANFITTLVVGEGKLQEAENKRIVKDAASLGDSEAQGILNQRQALATTDFNEGVTGSRRRFGGKRKKEAEEEVKALEKNFAIRSKINAESTKIMTEGDLLIKNLMEEVDLRKRIEENEKNMSKTLAEKVSKVEQQFDLHGKELKTKLKQLELDKQLFELEASKNGISKEEQITINDTNTKIEAQKDLIDKNNEAKAKGVKLTKELHSETNKIADAFEKIGLEILDSVKDGIAGLIKGTSTLSDLLNNVANKFLDVALNQALFGSVLGSAGDKGGGLFGALGLFANGGRPPVGKPSIVGEKGPELFVPRSSGTIVPNNKLGGGGSTSVVVNVDASGTDVQGNEGQAKELGTLISVAVQGELIKQQRPGGLLASTR
jgi:hypothetical protein